MDETRFGLPIATWTAAKDEATAILQEIARQKKLITYSDLAREISSAHFERHDFRLFGLIGDISEEENALGRGMLSALVVTQDERKPGLGFFELAKKLGFKPRNHLAFWSKEVERVYAAWDI